MIRQLTLTAQEIKAMLIQLRQSLVRNVSRDITRLRSSILCSYAALRLILVSIVSEEDRLSVDIG